MKKSVDFLGGLSCVVAVKLKELQDKHLCFKLIRESVTIAVLVVSKYRQ